PNQLLHPGNKSRQIFVALRRRGFRMRVRLPAPPTPFEPLRPKSRCGAHEATFVRNRRVRRPCGPARQAPRVRAHRRPTFPFRSADVMKSPELIIGIGGAAGDGVASAGNTLALAAARQGLGVYAYNSYQSVIRGGHSWLRLRVSGTKPVNHGDQVDGLIALNQDTLDRHLPELKPGGVAVFNSNRIKSAGTPPAGVHLCALPVSELCPAARELPVMQNTVAVGAMLRLMGLDFAGLESVLQTTFAKKPKVVAQNMDAARAGYEHAAQSFPAMQPQLAV